MRLVLGPEHLTSPPGDHVCNPVTGETWEVWDSITPWADQIEEVIVGFNDQLDLNFLRQTPKVRSVWIKTPTVTDLTGLLTLENLEKLSIDRPRRSRFDILGELKTLEELYIDNWRPGAESLFRLQNVTRLGIQRFPYPDLSRLATMSSLKELWLNAGKLEDVHGAPETLEKLRITINSKLGSLEGLRGCTKLADFRLEQVPNVHSLAGLEAAPLQVLVLIDTGLLATLAPLQGKSQLRFITAYRGTLDQTSDVSALYTLPNLEKLNITVLAAVDEARLRVSAPEIRIRRDRRGIRTKPRGSGVATGQEQE